jgi:uncharacterized protein (TIGR02271 family)
MSYETNRANRSGSVQLDAPRRTGFPFLDLMFAIQKTSQQTLSAYNLQSNGRYADQTPQSSGNTVEVIPLGEETLNVEARTVQGNTVRLRRVVVETPVEKQVALREEKVIVERRKPAAASTAQDILTEKSVEMTDTFEVINAWKSVRVLEEVVLRKEVTERVETVRDTVRRDEIEVERPNIRALPRRNTKD